MKQLKLSEANITAILKNGAKVNKLCRKHAMSDVTFLPKLKS